MNFSQALQYLWVTRWAETTLAFRWTLKKYSEIFIDALFTENPLLEMLKKKGTIKRKEVSK